MLWEWGGELKLLPPLLTSYALSLDNKKKKKLYLTPSPPLANDIDGSE